jgi:hypothetical protein
MPGRSNGLLGGLLGAIRIVPEEFRQQFLAAKVTITSKDFNFDVPV